MKTKLLFLLLLPLVLSSCYTNYYMCETDAPTPIYFNKSNGGEQITVIPKGKQVIIKEKPKAMYYKIQYNDTIGWAYIPRLKNKKKYEYKGTFKVLKKKKNKSSSYHSSGGTVHVKGYYRKDGTYVRPHTRRKPK
ncbi:SH3 domain-containing protein [Flavobacterium suaedae]|nr:SH3 domain-containing protein [Flavobacterium suaedae]